MNKLRLKILYCAVALILAAGLLYVGKEAAAYVMGKNTTGETRLCVMIDAGHGGMDPGKVGINGALEKDINLKIAKALKKYLEAEDIEVVMTRESDDGLYDADASNKKVQDMKRRVELIDTVKPVITVSIHQNSYPEEYVYGAQVFFYSGSAEGKTLAEIIQTQLVDKVDPQNKRKVKANDSYYLLKKTGIPIVIVEYCVSDRQTGL